jgi:signal transduction histidine kinase
MNKHLQTIAEILQQSDSHAAAEKEALLKAVKDADKEFEIITFKLDRTEKVKRTTAILLEETIEELEQKRRAVEESHAALQKSLEELQATQQQLIQAEKMASLGELTAGIAHEIQNPLNFVNNFSEVNLELISELVDEVDKGNTEDVKQIAADIKENTDRIHHHGRRADAIVKSMLQHSQRSSGQKEPTDINALCEEYLRLAYHGLRAKDNSFNAAFDTNLDAAVGRVNVMPQEIGRVLLNLINNAFYAVSEKSKTAGPGYQPTVTVSTKAIDSKVMITVSDNGGGIPEAIRDKIFQPFFTTKPTGQGTGLGLSLSYDIITKGHGGELKLESLQNAGTTFTVSLPTLPATS